MQMCSSDIDGFASRAGLYKQLAETKNLVAEFREDPERNGTLRGPIVESLMAAGLHQDCPFRPASSPSASSNGHSGEAEELTAETAADVPIADFAEYAGRLNSYLQVTFAC